MVRRTHHAARSRGKQRGKQPVQCATPLQRLQGIQNDVASILMANGACHGPYLSATRMASYRLRVNPPWRR